jgi:GT2 family glycosyltransferase
LQAISCIHYPREFFEVIIVDDGGTVPLEATIAPFCDRFAVSLMRQDHEGVAVGRNTGAQKAKGEILIFTDDDCLPAPDWLYCLEKRFSESMDCIIGGRTLNALPDNYFSTASQSLVLYLLGYYNGNPRDARFLNGSNLAIPTVLFRALGGFDKTFYLMGAEEREFCDRWRYHGLGMVYAPEVVVFHQHHLTLRSFLRQHCNYGRGAFHFQKLHTERCGERIKVEPSAFYIGMLRYPFRTERIARALFVSLLLCVAQAVNAIGYFREKGIASRQKQGVNSKKS